MTKKIITGFNRRIYRFWAVLLAILLTLGVFPTQPAKADAVIDAVSVGINPNSIAMNTITNKIYVTSADPGKMTVIDCTDYNVITTFDIGGYPQGVAVDETDNKIYVTDTSNYDVLVFDGETNIKTETLDMEGMPGGIAWDSVNNLFYVTIWETGKVAVIDGVTDTILEYIDVGNYPEDIDVNVETDKIYVTHDNNTVSVIEGSSKTVVSTLSVDLYPQDIAVNTTTNKIYVIHGWSNKVTVIDGETDSITSIIEMGQDMITVAVNPSTNKIYVGDQAGVCVQVIDGTTDTVLQTIDFQDQFTPTDAVADKTRNKIYMTSLNTDDVKIIDGSGIDSVSVTGLTAPIQGELPGTVDSLMAGDDTYTVTGLTWQNYDGSAATLDGDGKFQNAGGLYRAFIELTAKPDNKFPPAFSYMPAVNTGFPSAGTFEGGDVLGNKLTFTVTFEENITRIGVTGLIGPQTGEAPISLPALTSNHPDKYSVTGLTWLNYTETPATLDGSGRFTSGGQTYLARIELTSMPGYKFSSSNLFPSLGGGMKLRSETRNIGGGSVTGNKFYFSVYFPADINTVNVSGLVAPVAGATPVNGGLTSIVSVTYVDFYTTPPSITSYSFSRDVNTLTWQNGDGTPATLTDGKFNPYSNYKVVIKLWSDNTAGYLCKFPVGGLTPAVNVGTPSAGVTGGGYVAGNSLTFEVAFPATGAIPFRAVTGITGVPATITAGADLTLAGTVEPLDATNQTIVWSVEDAGTTGATVSGSTLSTTSAGIVIVRATITNGLTESSDYMQDFTITVSATPVITYTVTFNSNGSVYTTKTVDAGESVGSAAWPADPVRSSYTFGGWFTGENGAGMQFTSSTPVNTPTAIYAKWTYSGGGGSSSGGGSKTSSTPTYNAEVNAGDGSNVHLPVTVDKSSGNASVDVGAENNLMSDGKTTVITVPYIPNVDTYSLGISVPSLSTQNEQGGLVFSTDTGTVTIPPNMLTGVTGISGSKAEISIGQGDKDNLPSDVKAAIGDKPLISLGLSIDGRQIDWSNPNAPVTVSIPYTPTAGELANSESIVIWYIDGSGNAVSVPNGHYDPATGTVTFTTTHFSLYAVIYNKMSFNDVAPNAWYSKAVSFIAARGITTGTGNKDYSPEAKLTRGEFIVLMMRAYGISPDANSTDNFADAGNTYCTGYLAAAKQLGISAGVGKNLFAPGKEITRQEMFTLLYNALKVIGQLPQGNSGKVLSDFTDAGQIDAWAKDAMMFLVESGTVGGSNNKLTPTGTTTRAEMAQVLYNLLDK